MKCFTLWVMQQMEIHENWELCKFLLSFYHHPRHHLQDHFLHCCLAVTRFIYRRTGCYEEANMCNVYWGHGSCGCKAKVTIVETIILPLGKYTAGGRHLRLLHNTFSKDQHGLWEKDINHKDKQNFEAVLRITSDSVMQLLTNMPELWCTEE